MSDIPLFDDDGNPTVFGPTPGRVHRGDPHTSAMAAANVRLRSGTQRWRVLCALVAAGPEGMTDYELGCALGLLRTAAGTRRKELAEADLVRATPRLRPTDTGNLAVVHIATEAGHRTVAGAVA